MLGQLAERDRALLGLLSDVAERRVDGREDAQLAAPDADQLADAVQFAEGAKLRAMVDIDSFIGVRSHVFIIVVRFWLVGW